MTFHPMDKRILICGLNTGQVMLLYLNNRFFEILNERMRKSQFIINKREIPYEIRIS